MLIEANSCNKHGGDIGEAVVGVTAEQEVQSEVEILGSLPECFLFSPEADGVVRLQAEGQRCRNPVGIKVALVVEPVVLIAGIDAELEVVAVMVTILGRKVDTEVLERQEVCEANLVVVLAPRVESDLRMQVEVGVTELTLNVEQGGSVRGARESAVVVHSEVVPGEHVPVVVGPEEVNEELLRGSFSLEVVPLMVLDGLSVDGDGGDDCQNKGGNELFHVLCVLGVLGSLVDEAHDTGLVVNAVLGAVQQDGDVTAGVATLDEVNHGRGLGLGPATVGLSVALPLGRGDIDLDGLRLSLGYLDINRRLVHGAFDDEALDFELGELVVDSTGSPVGERLVDVLKGRVLDTQLDEAVRFMLGPGLASDGGLLFSGHLAGLDVFRHLIPIDRGHWGGLDGRWGFLYLFFHYVREGGNGLGEFRDFTHKGLDLG